MVDATFRQAILAVFLWSPLQQPAAEPLANKVKALTLDQEAIGLPDERGDQPVSQTLVIEEAGTRVLLTQKPVEGPPAKQPGKGRKVLLTLAEGTPEITEIFDAERAFRSTRGDLNRIQEDRDRQEAQWRRQLGALEPAERERYLSENHVRPDGKREVLVERGAFRELLGQPCEEIRVLENGRVVLKAQVTRQIAGGKNFFELYAKLGAFSKQVLAELSQMDGVPLEAEIVVATAAPAFRIKISTRAIRREEVSPETFAVPAGYTERREDVSPFAKCPMCGKQVEKDHASPLRALGGETLYFCSRDCRKKWDEEDDRRREQKAKPEAKDAEPKPKPPGGK